MLLVTAFLRWRRDRVERYAAAIAYYSMFSLAPLLMLGVAVANHVASRRQTQEFVGDLARATMGEVGTRVVDPIIRVAPRPGADITASLLVLLTLLYGASSLFIHLQEALDAIFGAEPRDMHWFKAFLARRVSAALVCGAFVALLVLGPTFGAAAVHLGRSQLPHIPMSLLVETLSFTLVFGFVPNIRLPWGTILPGAFLTAALFTGAQSLLSLYLGAIAARSLYGAASFLAVLLVWVYASAQLLLFGAEIIQAWRDQTSSAAEQALERRGSRPPKPG